MLHALHRFAAYAARLTGLPCPPNGWTAMTARATVAHGRIVPSAPAIGSLLLALAETGDFVISETATLGAHHRGITARPNPAVDDDGGVARFLEVGSGPLFLDCWTEAPRIAVASHEAIRYACFQIAAQRTVTHQLAEDWQPIQPERIRDQLRLLALESTPEAVILPPHDAVRDTLGELADKGALREEGQSYWIATAVAETELSAPRVATLYGCTPKHVWDLCDEGALPYRRNERRPDNNYRFIPADLALVFRSAPHWRPMNPGQNSAGWLPMPPTPRAETESAPRRTPPPAGLPA